MHRRGGGTVRRGRTDQRGHQVVFVWTMILMTKLVIIIISDSADQRGHQVVFVWTMIMMTKMVILMMMISMGVILR